MIQPHVLTNEGKRVLLDEVTGNGFTLIQIQADSGEAAEDITWFTDVLGGKTFIIGKDFRDFDGKLFDFFTKNDIKNVLVRPDRYIFSAGESASELTSQLRKDLSAYSPTATKENRK